MRRVEEKLFRSLLEHQSGKTTTIRRTAFRETGVSRHHEGPIDDLFEIPQN